MRFCQMHVRNLPFNPVIPNVRFRSPWKHQKSFFGQGDQKRTLGRKGLKLTKFTNSSQIFYALFLISKFSPENHLSSNLIGLVLTWN